MPSAPSNSRPPISERLRRYALVLAAIAVGLIAALALSLHLLWQHEREARADHLRGMAGATIGYVDRGLERVDRALMLLVDQLGRPGARGLAVIAALPDALDRIRHLGPLLETVGVLDADGQVVAISAPDGSPSPQWSPDASVLRDHRASSGRGLMISGPFRRGESWAFALSRAVRGGDDALVAVVYATVDVRTALEALDPMRPRRGGRLTILTDRFIVLARSPESGIGEDLSHSDVADRIRGGERAGSLRSGASPDGFVQVTSFAVSQRHGLIAVSDVAVPELANDWIALNLPALALIAALILTGLGMMVWLVVMLRSDSRRDERLRESSEAALRDSIECMGEGFVLWDRDERLVLWNRRYPELLPHLHGLIEAGVHLETIRAEAARRAFPDLDAAGVAAWLAARRRRQANPGVPFELDLADGRTVQVVEHRTSEGGRVAIYRDITGERRALRELAASEARFRDGIESIADGFILWDPDDRVAAWNRRCEALLPASGAVLRLGLGFEQYARESIALNHPGLTPAECQARIADRIAQHRDRNRTSEFTSSHGRVIEVRESASSNGGCVSLYRDVTEERRLLARLTASEAELQRALAAERELNAQQRRFVSMASHEFRTPLAIIDSATQRIQTRIEAEPGSELHKRFERIRGAVARMTEIIDRTLSTARLEDGRFEFEPTDCDFARLLADVCERQRSISPRHAIRLDIPAGPIRIEADPRLLDQIFSNLVSNAVKYSGASTAVDVAVVVHADTVEVAVRDQGIGIPAGERDRLFTRFFRSSTSLSIPGTGIGLHLVKAFVTLHGGVVEVHSEEQKGSIFTVRLPRRRGAVAARPAAA